MTTKFSSARTYKNKHRELLLLLSIKNSIESRNLTNETKPDEKPTKCSEFGWVVYKKAACLQKTVTGGHYRSGHFSREGTIG